MRLHRRRGNGGLTRGPFFESDLKIDAFKPQLRNGAQENWIGKWCKVSVENAAVMDLGLSEDERDKVLGTGAATYRRAGALSDTGSWHLVDYYHKEVEGKSS